MDLGRLVFGDVLPDGTQLNDAFAKAFSQEKVKQAWSKIGLFPFNRAALESKKIRHELVVESQNGQVSNTADSKAHYLQHLRDMNELCCDILNHFGANGELFRKRVVIRNDQERSSQLTLPHTRERQDAIAKATSQGGVFLRTGGVSCNTDDVFIALERAERKLKLKKLEAEKAECLKNMERTLLAAEILNRVDGNDEQLNSTELKHMIAWKLGKPCPSNVSTASARRMLWNQVKNTQGDWQQWTNDDEERLIRLRSSIDNIDIKQTLLGKRKRRHQCLNCAIQESDSEQDEPEPLDET